MKRVLVLGSAGQLGGEFVRRLEASASVVAADADAIDVRDSAALRRLAADTGPDTIVNCTAWNGVDQAERSPFDALAVNAWAVRGMAAVAAELDATLVHFSTDFVFDGTSPSPYVESDAPSPLSTYGMSKLLGEVACEAAPKRYVLRLSSLFGGPQRRSYVDCIADTLREGISVPVYTDRTVSPSFAPDVVTATLALLASKAPSGIYHCASADFSAWYDVGCEIARQLACPASLLQPTPFSNEQGRARRPRNCALSSARLAAATGLHVQGWRSMVARHLASSRNG
jgi:dTDP-4-dehydrorhamnose reductase